MIKEIYARRPILWNLGFVASWMFALFLWYLPAAKSAIYVGDTNNVIDSSVSARAVTTSDTVDLPLGPPRFLYNGNAAACNIAVILANDTVAVTFSNVPPGVMLRVRPSRVMATNTTCTGLVATY